MTLLQAFIYYIVRLGLYAAVAAGGDCYRNPLAQT